LLTNAKKNTVHRVLEKTVRQLYGDNIFRTVIPSRTVFEQAICARKPVTHYRPKSDVADAFRQVLQEIGKRITEAREITHEKVANE
jgi:cellulose biosynthesis protein BcsQ